MHKETIARPDNREDTKVIFSCPAQGIIDIVSKKWTFLLIAILGNSKSMRYTDIKKEINSISPKTLSDTLKAMVKAHIIKRESFNEVPPRVEYSLTEDGLELRVAIIPILKWALERSKEKKCIILSKTLELA